MTNSDLNILDGLVDFIVKLKIDGLTNNHLFALKINSLLGSYRKSSEHLSIFSFFEMLTGKHEKSKCSKDSQVRIIFKLVNNQNSKVQVQQIWEIQCLSLKSQYQNKSNQKFFCSLNYFVQDIVRITNSLSRWQDKIANIQNNILQYSLTYQINQFSVCPTPKLGFNKTEFEQKIQDKNILFRIYSENTEDQVIAYSDVTSVMIRERKQSISTVGSISDTDLSSKIKKKNIYLYEDEEQDIIFLTQHKLILQEDIQMEEFSIELEETEDEDFQTIISEQDQKLNEFRWCLKQLQEEWIENVETKTIRS